MKIAIGEGTLAAKDGTKIFFRWWKPDEPRAIVTIAHGLGEHSGRYDHVGRKLADAGLAVFAGDHRGHGRSEGKRGHVNRFDEFLDDLDLVIDRARSDAGAPGGKLFLIGHSLGGLIAGVYACERPAKLAGLVTSSGAFQIAVQIPAAKAAAGKLLSRILPSLTLSNELNVDAISRDRAVVDAYRNDPLVHDRASARFFTEFLAAIEKAHAGAPSIKLPSLVLQAGADQLVHPDGSRKFFAKIGGADKKLKVYDGLFHEIFNEPEKEQVLGDLLEWLRAHC